jgi:membrane fusion protein, multidrug efflux system
VASKSLVWIWAVIGLAGASAGGWYLQSRSTLTSPKEMTGSAPAAPGGASSGPVGGASRAAGVEVFKVERTLMREEAQAVGTMRSRQGVMLKPEVAGRIASIGFKDGERVTQGQVLVQLDDVLQKAEVQQAQAQVAIAQANYKRNQELVAQGFIAQRVLDESQAALQVAQAQLALGQARLQRMRLVAPFDGQAGIRAINIGDFVKDGADLVNIEDLSSMVVDFRVPERFLPRLRKGQRLDVQLDAFPGRSFKAAIEAIDPLIDANGRSVAVRGVMPNTGGEPIQVAGGPGGVAAGGGAQTGRDARPVERAAAATQVAVAGGGKQAGRPATRGSMGSGPLRPGMFARVNVVIHVNPEALVVPEEAIVPQGGRQFVIKVVAPSAVPGTATAALAPDVQTVSLRQEVKLGARRAGRVELQSGVVEGETVVVAGQQRLQRDGTAVRIVESSRPAGGGSGSGGAGAGAAPVVGAVSAPATAVDGNSPKR